MQALAFVVPETVVSQQHDIAQLLSRHHVQLRAVRQVRRLVEHDLAVLQMGFERLHSWQFSTSVVWQR